MAELRAHDALIGILLLISGILFIAIGLKNHNWMYWSTGALCLYLGFK